MPANRTPGRLSNRRDPVDAAHQQERQPIVAVLFIERAHRLFTDAPAGVRTQDG
jgi:hypothetical protein